MLDFFYTNVDETTAVLCGLAIILFAGFAVTLCADAGGHCQAIGLVFPGQRQLSPDKGSLLLTIILSSSVLYELTGPAAAKWALIKASVIREEKKKAGGEQEETKHSEAGLEE